MKILVVGDTHGNIDSLVPKLYVAGELRINHVMVVGDFGLWTHRLEGHVFLDEVNEAARINNLSVYAIGGNHENWDHWNHVIETMPTHKGFGMVRSRILLAPKAHTWVWAHKVFVGAGGAVSIDKAWRVAKERGGTWHDTTWNVTENMGRGLGHKTLWWPNEELTDEDVAFVKSFGKADYLFTHDCSNHTPWGKRLKPDTDSEIHRRRIDEVIKATAPTLHFHGHMHEKYDWNNVQSHGFYNEFETGAFGTRTLGLENDKNFNSWGVLDVEKGEWKWAGKVMEELEDQKALFNS